MNRLLEIFPTKRDVAEAAAARLVDVLATAIDERGQATMVLTGGSMGEALMQALVSESGWPLDWRRVDVWWGDERFLPAGDPDRNDTQAARAGLDRLGLAPERIHPMPAPRSPATGSRGPDSVADRRADADAAAQRYARELASAAAAGQELPLIDVLMLGVGPDAHVASLFPGHPALLETAQSVVAVFDAPKPPPTRISLSMPALCRAERVWLMAAGPDKAAAVALGQGAQATGAESSAPIPDATASLASVPAAQGPGPEGPAAQVPAAMVRGQLVTAWWLDHAAAGLPE